MYDHTKLILDDSISLKAKGLFFIISTFNSHGKYTDYYEILSFIKDDKNSLDEAILELKNAGYWEGDKYE